jgi:hypothetical protein
MRCMVVLRPVIFALGWFALACVAGAAVAAESCAPGAIVASYRQAEAAYGRKDFAGAAAQFRPLAEQGLGAAQLRLGEMLSGDGGKQDLVEAYRWIALAANVGAPGAQAALDRLTPRLTAQQIAQANIAPQSWQPAQLGPCLSVDPRLKGPNGTTGYALERLVNRVMTAKSATGPAAQRLDWLAHALESVRTGSPRYLIYFKALYGVAFVGGAGSFVVAEQRDNLPMIVINESYTGTLTVERLAELVKAAIYAVDANLMPPDIATATETYKGYTIRTTATDGGRRFVEFVKFAIDMTEQLPPDLLKLARAVTDLRYEPQLPFDDRNGAVSLANYRHDGKTGQGYMSYRENFSMRGPSHIVITLVDAGIHQRRDRAGGKLVVSSPTHGDCELEDVDIKTMEALKLDSIEINRAYKSRLARGCG